LGLLRKLFGEKKPRVDPVSLDETNFDQEVLNHKGPCLVDVWTETCSHCVKLAPTIIALATKYQGRVKVCELNASKFPGPARRMQVRGTPTVVVFEDGNLLGRVTGFRLQSYYEEMIETEFPLKESETGS
jgi:thioredoxin-like negative regulator of GroEL